MIYNNSTSKNYIMKLNKRKKNKERMYAQYTNGNKIKYFFFFHYNISRIYHIENLVIDTITNKI